MVFDGPLLNSCPVGRPTEAIHSVVLACVLFLCPCVSVSQAPPAASAAGLASSDESPVAAQPAVPMLSSYEGQNVSSIQIAGRPDLDAAQFQPLFVQREGQPFSQSDVQRTAAALQASGKAGNVRIQVEPTAAGVEVLFVLDPAIYFGIFEFPGAEHFAYSQLVQIANYPTQTPFNAGDVEQDRKNLVAFFQQEGYFEAAATAQVEVDAANALANIAFHVTLGRNARFGSITIEDATPSDQAQLQHKLTTLMARLRGAGICPGKAYHHSALRKATAYLQATLQKQGYLGAEVKLKGAQYNAATNRADIYFTVNPGELTQVQVNGAHLWSWTRKSILPIYQGIGVDDESVQEGGQTILSYFQSKGYFDVKVDSDLKSDANAATVTYQVTRGKKHRVTAVTLAGNTQLPGMQLAPDIVVDKKHLFSSGKFSDALVRTSVKNLTAVYEAEGFSSVKVTSSVQNRGGDIQVSFRVVEGPRDVVSSVSIEGADTFPESQFAPAGLKVRAGEPYSAAHVAADRGSIMAHYLQAGYLNSSLRETATIVSKQDPHHIDVVYHIHEGPRVAAGELIMLGRLHTQQRLIDRDTAQIKTGQPLTESDLLTAGSKLYDHTGVFNWAEVDPKRDITTQTSEDVLIKVHEAKKNEFTYGLGFEVIDRGGSIPSGTVALPNLPPVGLPSDFRSSESTFYGPRGTVEYTRNNFRGKGESLSFTAFAGRLDQRVAAYYIDPDLRWSPWKATASLSYERNQENPIFSSQIELGSYQIQRPLDKAKKNTLFTRYSFSQTDLTRVLIPALVPAQDQHVRLSTLAANLTHDTRDNPFDEHKGMLGSIELDFNTTKLGSSVNFAKLTGQAAYYKEKLHRIVWAESVRIGLAQPFAGSRVPLSEEFFSGGGNSLRGFPLESAGPQRQVEVCSSGVTSNCPEIQVAAGGNELLIINAEARIPLDFKKGLSIVPFYDGGNVFTSVGFRDFAGLYPYSNGVGLGVRYATPVGPIRVDVGQNLNPITGVKSTNYFISIGQAF